MARDKQEAVHAGEVEARFAWAAGEVAKFMEATQEADWSGDVIVTPAEAKNSDCMAALVAVAAYFAAEAGYGGQALREFSEEYQRRATAALIEGQ